MTVQVGGSSGSGLRRDAAGREIRDGDDGSARRGTAELGPGARDGNATAAVDAESGPGARSGIETAHTSAGNAWDSAPPRKVRLQHKQRPVVSHEAVLGPEPMALKHDGDAEGADDDPHEVMENIPELRTRQAAKKPSAVEQRRHAITHLPHELWCDICVAGRGQGRPHNCQRRADEMVCSLVCSLVCSFVCS